MSDLIERLREPLDKRLPLRVHNERREAADEIERLRNGWDHAVTRKNELLAENARLQAVLDAGLADLETRPQAGRSIDYANGFRVGAQCQRMKLRAALAALQETDDGG